MVTYFMVIVLAKVGPRGQFCFICNKRIKDESFGIVLMILCLLNAVFSASPFSGTTRMQKSLFRLKLSCSVQERFNVVLHARIYRWRLKLVRLYPKSVSLKMHSQRINVEGRHAFKNSHCNGLDHRNLVSYKPRWTFFFCFSFFHMIYELAHVWVRR